MDNQRTYMHTFAFIYSPSNFGGPKKCQPDIITELRYSVEKEDKKALSPLFAFPLFPTIYKLPSPCPECRIDEIIFIFFSILSIYKKSKIN